MNERGENSIPPVIDDSSHFPVVPEWTVHESEEVANVPDDDEPDCKVPGRRIDIEYIDDKQKRIVTFSKRKAGLMKKASELATLTGSEVLLLTTSETGLLYSYVSDKLKPLIHTDRGRSLIHACLDSALTGSETTSKQQGRDCRPSRSAATPLVPFPSDGDGANCAPPGSTKLVPLPDHVIPSGRAPLQGDAGLLHPPLIYNNNDSIGDIQPGAATRSAPPPSANINNNMCDSELFSRRTDGAHNRIVMSAAAPPQKSAQPAPSRSAPKKEIDRVMVPMAAPHSVAPPRPRYTIPVFPHLISRQEAAPPTDTGAPPGTQPQYTVTPASASSSFAAPQVPQSAPIGSKGQCDATQAAPPNPSMCPQRTDDSSKAKAVSASVASRHKPSSASSAPIASPANRKRERGDASRASTRVSASALRDRTGLGTPPKLVSPTPSEASALEILSEGEDIRGTNAAASSGYSRGAEQSEVYRPYTPPSYFHASDEYVFPIANVRGDYPWAPTGAGHWGAESEDEAPQSLFAEADPDHAHVATHAAEEFPQAGSATERPAQWNRHTSPKLKMPRLSS